LIEQEGLVDRVRTDDPYLAQKWREPPSIRSSAFPLGRSRRRNQARARQANPAVFANRGEVGTICRDYFQQRPDHARGAGHDDCLIPLVITRAQIDELADKVRRCWT
jgi:hypothetical protein